TRYVTEVAGAPVAEAAPLRTTGPHPALAHLGGLALDHLARKRSALEPLQSLTSTAAGSHACQVLEALSKTALLLRDSAVSAARGVPAPSSHDRSPQGMQRLFQNGYDVMALPLCMDAYGPAAVVPETCVALFHIHNLLLQAAYASSQDFEPYTELIQAGLGLYLLKAPRALVSFTNGQLDAVLDAMAHQDLWRFQRLLWSRLLPCIPAWESQEDFCSVVHDCELQAQTAAAAAAAASTSAGGSGIPAAGVLGRPSVSRPSSLAPGFVASFSDRLSDTRPQADTRAWPAEPAGLPSTSGPPYGASASAHPAHSQHGLPASASASTSGSTGGSAARGIMSAALCAPSTAAQASALYDKQAELEDHARLMSECIRAALEAAASKLMLAPQPHAAARTLLDVAIAFDARQRSLGTPPVLRYTFMPSHEWLSHVAAAGAHAGDRMDPAAYVKLLRDLDTLSPQPLDLGASNRWLNAAGQAGAEAAVLHHTAMHAWAPQQTVTVLLALAGKCQSPPGDKLCGAAEGIVLACGEGKQDISLLCAMLQDALELASPTSGGLSAAHQSLVRALLNKAIYVVGSMVARGCPVPQYSRGTSLSSQLAGELSWCSREFLFDCYPRLLQAAKRFGYPLQAFHLSEYAAELYSYLAAAPGHELVAVGPEGLTRILAAVVATPCCSDPHWAAAFERACLTLLTVQFGVGYTHPKRWVRLVDAVVAQLPFPMPALTAGVKALMVRLCDVHRHSEYFFTLLPLVGTLERRAAGASRHLHHQEGHDAAGSLWTPVSSSAAAVPSAGPVPATPSISSGHAMRFPKGRSPGTHRGAAAAAGARRGSSSGRSSSLGGSRSLTDQDIVGTAPALQGGALRALVPPPDMTRHLVSDLEYSKWCEEVGQRLALSMACMADRDRVAQLSMLGIE
ncbi:hypothetical protein TSOC_001696, partial [Tetrabaena socialis]